MFPFRVVVVADVLNISLIDVAELVAVVTTHPALTVDVAAVLFPRVKLLDSTVVLAAVFLMVSPKFKRMSPTLNTFEYGESE